MKIKWSWNKIIRCWKVLEKSLIFRSCVLYEPCSFSLDIIAVCFLPGTATAVSRLVPEVGRGPDDPVEDAHPAPTTAAGKQ